MSITLTLNGTDSVLESSYFPQITLDRPYELSLLLMETFMSVPNVTSENNKFEYSFNGKEYTIALPIGCYEKEDIASYLQDKIRWRIENNLEGKASLDEDFKKKVLSTTTKKYSEIKDEYFVLKSDKVTLKCDFYTKVDIHVGNDSVLQMLGFRDKEYNRFNWHRGTVIADINRVNIIKVLCNIVQGGYEDGVASHSIYEFSASIEPGSKISENPRTLIYYPVLYDNISHVVVQIVDQDNKPIDFRGERITVRLHLKPI